MRMQRLVIFLLAGLMFLPMAFTEATARPTVINLEYSAQPKTDQELTLRIHAFGFPGEELDWSGTFVIPANQDTQPSWTSSITVTSASYSSVGLGVSFELADSTNPDIVGCRFEVGANIYGTIGIDAEYMGVCPDINIFDNWATLVINM